MWLNIQMRPGSCAVFRPGPAVKFDEEDMAILNDVFADDVTWHSTGRGAIQQDVVGKEASSALALGRRAER